ncbi:hypothetical protein [Tenggerimyces flavus]|uniref:DUF2127 domain-containing protein n=1 Tax=Tenggerimyces flavus TaxID=1708749 RepID=A0ABV7YIS4_9ACTN|nr:hypothetical protein [Tenggerimyces flavus]MBM7784043.1 heme A synthase [Tenggerimyces flavus]
MSEDRPSKPMPSWPSDPKDAVVAPSDRPRLVLISVILMYAGGVVSAVAGALTYFIAPREALRQAAEQSLRQRKQAVTPAAVDALVNSTVTMVVTIMVVSAVVWAVIAYFTSRRMNWARMIATVLGVLNVFATFTFFGRTPSALLLMLIGLASVALLWTQTSRQWFGSTPKLKV